MILSTVVPINDLLSEPFTHKGCIVAGHSAGAPATLSLKNNPSQNIKYDSYVVPGTICLLSAGG